jgi:hypothetical protein
LNNDVNAPLKVISTSFRIFILRPEFSPILLLFNTLTPAANREQFYYELDYLKTIERARQRQI